jgi:hypothetical protein
MADENKPAFYPRVGNIKAKNFKSAQPMPFVEDPRAMDLPQYGDIDLSIPTKENLEMGRRMAERDAQLRRQQQADRSPLEKLAGGVQAGRLMGSALAQSVASIPTALREGSKAADEYIAQNMYKPTQPLAYEYAQDVGDFLEKLETEYKIPPILPEAMALQFLTGPGTSQAARAAGKGAVKAGRALERRMEPVVTGALEQGGLPREMALGMGQGMQSNIIKPVGGNWKPDSVERSLRSLKSPVNPDELLKNLDYIRETGVGYASRDAALQDERLNNNYQNLLKDKALDQWVDTNLTNYITKQMGTEKDPVRLLADQGITHFADEDAMRRALSTSYDQFARNRRVRKNFDMPVNPMAQTSLGRTWEEGIDDLMGMSNIHRAKNYGNAYIREKNPWINKLDPDTKLYGMDDLMPMQMNFGHIMDVLKEDLATGRLSPEDLKNVSMDRAVRRTHEYNLERAKAIEDAQAKKLEGMTIYKEYPEGFRWVQLDKPGQFAAESDAMGHSVRGYEPPLGHPDYVQGSGNAGSESYGLGGWDAIKRGDAKVYSLVDKSGRPHTTIEVGRGNDAQAFFDAHKNYLDNPVTRRDLSMMVDPDLDIPLDTQRVTAMKQLLDEMGVQYGDVPEAPPHINQIKGKGNRTPNQQYLPYVQDFVKSGKWSQVNDIDNSGLIQHSGRYFTEPELIEAAKKYGRMGVQDVPWEVARQRHIESGVPEDKALQNWIEAFKEGRGKLEFPPDGMKRGGVVVSKNPDTMMLEVNNQKMKNGEPAYGAGKLVTTQAVKSTKVPPPIKFPVTRGPSIPEIRAMAERMAPQVMGEFVRAAPTPSNPKPSTSVVGKTQKQFERERTLPIEYQNIKEPVTPEEFDYAKKKGALLIGGAGDVTPGNRMLVSIDDQPLSAPVHLQAGPEWEMYNPSAWAASDQMAKTYMNRAGKAAEAYDADPYLHYHKMTPDANFYAMHHLNSILGHLRPEELMLRDPKLYQQMVEEIRTRDVGYGKHPEFEGFEDPLNLQIHAQIDPNFRRHLSAIFNGPKFTERYGLNSGQDVLAATSLPELRDLEPGASGYAIVPLDVKAPLRNFEADSQTYDTGFPKAGPSGRSKYPSPYQLIYRDTLNWMKENPSENKSSEFGRMNMIVPKQQIDNELIEAIGEYQRRMKELTGKKKGGAIKKAEGGYLKKPAAYINGDEFVNAAKKYGIKDSMNNLNKIVDLVNKGLSVDDAARQVADSGMHKAAGGAISGDDLIIEERPL